MPTRRLRVLAAAALLCASAGGAFSAGEQLEPGLKALKAGKHDAAIKAFTQVLSTRTTTGPDLAKAYYYRGTAYSKAGKPAQCIADLSNALWLKGGLADDERQSALTMRAAAYEQTGFTARAQADLAEAARISGGAASTLPPAVQQGEAQPVQKAAKTATSSWQTEAAPGETPQLSAVPTSTATETPGQSSGGIGGFFTGLFSGGSQDSGETTSTAAASAPSSSNRRDNSADTGSVRSGARTRDSGAAQQTANAAPAPAQPPAVAPATPGWEEPTVTAATPSARKVKSVQLASSSAQEVPAAEWQTDVSAGQPAPAPQAQPAQSQSGGIGGLFDNLFGGATAEAPAAQPVETASIAKPAASGTTSTDALPWTGSTTSAAAQVFRLQVASLRNPAEASAVASELQVKHTELLARHSVAPQVTQQVLGAMGTFYQVTVGPFHDERTSLKACNELRRGGYDCFLVEN